MAERTMLASYLEPRCKVGSRRGRDSGIEGAEWHGYTTAGDWGGSLRAVNGCPCSRARDRHEACEAQRPVRSHARERGADRGRRRGGGSRSAALQGPPGLGGFVAARTLCSHMRSGEL